MDLSKLDQNERLAAFGAIAVVLAGLISSWGGLLFLAILAAIAALAVVFLPQLSPGTTLPGSKGSLLAAAGFVAAAATLITLLQWVSFLSLFGFSAIMFLVALIGALVMAWAGWQELQAEGGTWRFGTASSGRAASAGTPAAGTTPAAASADEASSFEDARAEHEATVADADEPRAEDRRTEA